MSFPSSPLINTIGLTPCSNRIMFPSSHWTPVKNIVQWVNEVVLSSFTAVVTNVPGPAGEKIDIEGHRVVSLFSNRQLRAESDHRSHIKSTAGQLCLPRLASPLLELELLRTEEPALSASLRTAHLARRVSRVASRPSSSDAGSSISTPPTRFWARSSKFKMRS